MRFSSLLLQSPLLLGNRLSRGKLGLSRNLVMSSSSRDYGSLINADEALNALKTDKKVKFVDATWYLAAGRDPKAEFVQARIPGARFFDIDAIADKTSSLPHMLPSNEDFSRAITDMGISNDDHVVVYTQKEAFSGARVWWTFRVFGHNKVSLLQGGMHAWKNEVDGPIESGAVTPAVPASEPFRVEFQSRMVTNYQKVLEVVFSGSKQILDARSEARFLGSAPEPRPGLAGGHIPGSLNLPFTALMEDGDVTRFKSPLAIKNTFQRAGLILGSDVILSCGSGVTAAVLFFGLHLLGIEQEKLAIYDGSWSEWGAIADAPIHNPTLEEAESK